MSEQFRTTYSSSDSDSDYDRFESARCGSRPSRYDSLSGHSRTATRSSNAAYTNTRPVTIINRVDPSPHPSALHSQTIPERTSYPGQTASYNRPQVILQSSYRPIAHHAEANPDIVTIPNYPRPKPAPQSSYVPTANPFQDSSKSHRDTGRSYQDSEYIIRKETTIHQDKSKPYQDGRKSPALSSGQRYPKLDIVEPGSQDFQERFIKELGAKSKIGIQLRMPNIFSSFLETELAKGDSLWDLVVLTGEPTKGLLSTTCGSYIAETWPSASDRIHKLINYLEDDSRSSTSLVLTSPTGDEVVASIERNILTTKGVELAMGFRGKVESMLDVLEGISWLFSALQSWGQSEPADCRMLWHQRGIVPGQKYDMTYGLHISDLFPLSVPEKGSCWKPLFPRTPTSTGFITRKRPAGMHGVEMNFELLCQLCGLDYMTTDDKGLLLFGPKSLVYPVRAEGNCVQWHFQECEPDNEDQHEITGDRLCVLDLASLCGQFTRHFLGLWSKSSVTLGTDLQKYDVDKWSEATEVPQESVRDGFNYGAAISIKGILTLNWGQSYKIANTRKPLTMTSITNRLFSSRNEPVILYSPQEARAWMVPFMSVFWHLLRAQGEAMKRLGYSIPACDQSGNGAEAAFECFMNNRNEPARRPAPNRRLTREEEQETIQTFAEDLWRTLDLATRQSCVSKKFFRNSIVGFEFAAISTCAPSMTLRTHSLDFGARHSWAPFLDRVRLTFFYEGLVDPILPSSEMRFTGTCGRTTWRAVPKGHNLLTASLPCLAHSIRDLNAGSSRLKRVTPDKSWSTTRPRGTLFNMCSSTSNHTCDRILELTRDHKANDPLVSTDDATKDGAVIFRFKDKFEDITGARRPPSPTTNGFLRPPSPSPNGSGRNSSHGSHNSSSSRDSHRRTDSGYSSATNLPNMSRLSISSDRSSVAVASEGEDASNNSTKSDGSKKSNSKLGKGEKRVVKRNGKLYWERRSSSNVS